jgi:hypothetical protein
MTRNAIHFHQSWYYCSCFVHSKHYNCSIITTDINQCLSKTTVLPEKLTVAQLFNQFPVFSRTHGFITISTTAWLTPSHLIPLAHLSSVLTNILHCTISLLRPICLVHFKCYADSPKWGTKKVRHWQITEILNWSTELKLEQTAQDEVLMSNPTNPNLTYI